MREFPFQLAFGVGADVDQSITEALRVLHLIGEILSGKNMDFDQRIRY